MKNGGKIHISEDGDIMFDGFKDFKFKCDGDMDFEAENINMHAKSLITNVDGPIYMGSSDYIIQQGVKMHLNPFGPEEHSGYFGNIKNKVLDYFKFIRE